MKYKALTFDTNKPIAQQITEPLNSDYGVAVKVYKDGQLVDVDLSVDGVACVEGFDGWKLAELSSEGTPTLKTLDVEVCKEPTVYKEINPVGEAVNSTSRIKSMAIQIPMSEFFDSDITIKPEDVKVLSFKTRAAAYDAEYPDEWTDTSNLYTNPGHFMSFADDNDELIYCVQQADSHSFYWYYRTTGTYEYGEKTLPTSYKVWLNTSQVPGHKKIEYSAVI